MSKREYSVGQFLQDYWRFLGGVRARYAYYSLVRVVSSIGGFFTAYLLGMIVDSFVAGATISGLALLTGVIAAVGVVSALLRVHAKLGLHKIAAKVRIRVRKQAVTKLFDLSLSWHEKEATGSKVEKISRGGGSLYGIMQIMAINGIETLVDIVGAVILFAALSGKYVLFAAVYGGIYLLVERYFSGRLVTQQRVQDRVREKVSAQLHEATANTLTVKSLGLWDDIKRALSNKDRHHYRVWMKTRKLTLSKSLAINTFAAIGYGAFVFVAGLDALVGVITIGSIYTYASYFGRLRGGLRRLTDMMPDLIKWKSHVGRMMTIIDGKSEVEGSQVMPKDWKRMVFDRVSFRYRDKWVLKNFSL
ncbi:hypothetical protein GF342_04335, partial [Candidatus Woesearchaeota archaeon]|nr:hypothetical protein [Candidatus Woesearchaeota archaeon]